MPQGLTVTIEEGAVERDDQGRLIAFLRTRSPFQALQTLNERLGLSDFEAISGDEVVSVDSSKPTVFSATKEIIFPQGEKVLNIQTWREIVLPINMTIFAQSTASGVLSGNKFRGAFTVVFIVKEVSSRVEMVGDYEVNVA